MGNALVWCNVDYAVGAQPRQLLCRIFGYSQAKLDAVARRLNECPRQTLNFETPAERF
jgi:hypothetical protein